MQGKDPWPASTSQEDTHFLTYPEIQGRGEVGSYPSLLQWLTNASKDSGVCHPQGVVMAPLTGDTIMSQREESPYLLLISVNLDTKPNQTKIKHAKEQMINRPHPFPEVPHDVPLAEFGLHVQAVAVRQAARASAWPYRAGQYDVINSTVSCSHGYSVMPNLNPQKGLAELIILSISSWGSRLYILESVLSFKLKNKGFHLYVSVVWEIH